MAKEKGSIIIKKVVGGGHAGHHGGAWKVAYADFVTAMMAFFLVMWLMGSDEEIKASVTQYFNPPSTPWKAKKSQSPSDINPLGERNGSGESLLNGMEGAYPGDLIESPVRSVTAYLEEHKQISELVQELMDADKLYGMEVTIDFLKFSVSENAIFKPGTAEILPEATKTLDKLGQIFKGYKGHITVDGHTDQKSKDGSRGTYEFSLSRAVNVMNYLVEHRWVPEERIHPEGSGPRRNLASPSNEEGREKNRRIEFILSKKQTL